MPVIQEVGRFEEIAGIASQGAAFLIEGLDDTGPRRERIKEQTVKGLPERWGRKAAAELAALAPAVGQEPSQEYRDLCAVLDKLTSGPVPVDASYERIC